VNHTLKDDLELDESEFRLAVVNLWPLKIIYRDFGEKFTKFFRKVQVLALNMRIFLKFGLWVGWPWLIHGWEPRWYSGNVDITDWMLRLFGVLNSMFNVVWSFLLTVWTTVRLCAEFDHSPHQNSKPIWISGLFLRKVISTWRILVPLHSIHGWFKPWSVKMVHWIYTSIVRPYLAHWIITWWPRLEREASKKLLSKIQRLACISPCNGYEIYTAALEVLLNLTSLHLFLEGELSRSLCRVSLVLKRIVLYTYTTCTFFW
jgi:hypothetical protein